MNITLDFQTVAEFFHETLIRAFNLRTEDFSVTENGVHQYTINEHSLSFSISDIQNIANHLSSFSSAGGTDIYNSNEYEVVVRNVSRIPFLNMRGGVLEEKVDQVNKLKYFIGPLSPKHLIALLQNISTIGEPISLLKRISRYPLSHRAYKLRDEISSFSNAIDLIMKLFSMFSSLHIESQNNKTINEFEKFADSFLFEISYNLDISIMPQRHIEELVRVGRIIRERRSTYEEIDVPRRHYIKDLVHHYQMGVSAEDPFLEFISFYHVAEHFFQSVYEDEVINQIKDKITHPNFSYKRKNDIKTLIGSVKKLTRTKEDGIGVSEIDALEYTIRKFVNLDDLKNKIQSYDNETFLYYINSEVPFSSGPQINFTDEDENKTLKSIAKRIYYTRNAIVHSKDGEKGKYLPFSHEKQLVKEIPLIRFISESIIIKNSKVVDS